MVYEVNVTRECTNLIYKIVDPSVGEEEIYAEMDQMVKNSVQVASFKRGSNFHETLRNFFLRPLREVLDVKDLPTLDVVNQEVARLTEEHLKSADPKSIKNYFKQLKLLALKPHIGVCPKRVDIKFGDVYAPMINEYIKPLQPGAAQTFMKEYEKEQKAFLDYSKEVIVKLNEFDCNCRGKVAGNELLQWYFTPVSRFWKAEGALDKEKVQKSLKKLIPVFKFVIEANEDSASNTINTFYNGLVIHFLKDQNKEDRYEMGVKLVEAMLQEAQGILKTDQLSKVVMSIFSPTVSQNFKEMIDFGPFLEDCDDCKFDFQSKPAESQALLIEKSIANLSNNVKAAKLNQNQLTDILKDFVSAVKIDKRVVRMIQLSNGKLNFLSQFLSEDEEINRSVYKTARNLFNQFVGSHLEVENQQELTTLLDQEIESLASVDELKKFYLVFKLWNFITFYNDNESKEQIVWGDFPDGAVELLQSFPDLISVYDRVAKKVQNKALPLAAFHKLFEFGTEVSVAETYSNTFEKGKTEKGFDVEFTGQGKSLHYDPNRPKHDVDEDHPSRLEDQTGPSMSKNKASKGDKTPKKKQGSFEEENEEPGSHNQPLRDIVPDDLEGDASGKLNILGGGKKVLEPKDLAGKVGGTIKAKIEAQINGDPDKDLAGKVGGTIKAKIESQIIGDPKHKETVNDGDIDTQKDIHKHPQTFVPGRENDEEGTSIKKPTGQQLDVGPKTGTSSKNKISEFQKLKLTLVDCKTILSQPSEKDEWWIEEDGQSRKTDENNFKNEQKHCYNGQYKIQRSLLTDCKFGHDTVFVDKRPKEFEQFVVVGKNGEQTLYSEVEFESFLSDCGLGKNPKTHEVKTIVIGHCNINIIKEILPGIAKPDEQLEKYAMMDDYRKKTITQAKFQAIKYQCDHPKMIHSQTLTILKDCTINVSTETHVRDLPNGLDLVNYIDKREDRERKVDKEQFKRLMEKCNLGTKKLLVESRLSSCQVDQNISYVDRDESDELISVEFWTDDSGAQVSLTPEEFELFWKFCQEPPVIKVTKKVSKGNCLFDVENVGYLTKPFKNLEPEQFFREQNGQEKPISSDDYQQEMDGCGNQIIVNEHSAVVSYWSAKVLDNCKPYSHIFSDSIDITDFVPPVFFLIVKNGWWNVVPESVFKIEMLKCTSADKSKTPSIQAHFPEDNPLPEIEKKVTLNDDEIPGGKTKLPEREVQRPENVADLPGQHTNLLSNLDQSPLRQDEPLEGKKVIKGGAKLLGENEGQLPGEHELPELIDQRNQDRKHILSTEHPERHHELQTVSVESPNDISNADIKSAVVKMIRRGFKDQDPREIQDSPLIVSYLKKNPIVVDEDEDVETLIVIVPVARTHADCYKHLYN